MKSTAKIYVFFIAFTLAIGGLAALLTMDNMNIYDSIVKPPFAPPGIVFPIVWGILYTLMAISVAKVYITGKNEGFQLSQSMTLYFLQLGVNFFWSIIFFNMQNFLFAFLWLVLLFALVASMILSFFRINKKAAILQLPYLLWIAFAGILNYAVFVLNVQ